MASRLVRKWLPVSTEEDLPKSKGVAFHRARETSFDKGYIREFHPNDHQALVVCIHGENFAIFDPNCLWDPPVCFTLIVFIKLKFNQLFITTETTFV